MLQLRDELLINRGNRRLVFVHPNEHTRCLKTAIPGSSPGEIRRRKVWYKRLRPDHSYDDNHLELVEYERLSCYVANPSFGLPRMYGMVATNRGPALDQELVRNGDGSVAPNLRAFAASIRANPKLFPQFEASVLRFTGWLVSNHIVVHDLHPQNLVVQQVGDDLRLVLIDGLGAYSLVPFEDLLPYPIAVWRLPGKIRRFQRLMKAVLGGNQTLHPTQLFPINDISH